MFIIPILELHKIDLLQNFQFVEEQKDLQFQAMKKFGLQQKQEIHILLKNWGDCGNLEISAQKTKWILFPVKHLTELIT